ncbi:MAG TPA: hypothetical protein VJT74_14870, partial [Pyrinomonadaceae bacterium]|nr:hypothetical protein [Pyrinomonadaceae bacterium]
VKTAGEAEFAVHYYYNHKGVGETGLSIVRGGVMIITIRDASKGVPRIIWLKIDNGESDNNLGFLNNADDINQSFIRLINPPGRLADHFISELKKLRREDADILLPPDFNYFQPSNPEKPRNTEGKFSEISNKRKVFVNVEGEAGEKITARLREYGRLEIVKTAGEAEIAVNYFSVSRVEAIARVVTGGTIIITIRDPLQHVPRIIWQKDDTDGGWLKRGDAFDKLIKRFISELKKLRGEK